MKDHPEMSWKFAAEVDSEFREFPGVFQVSPVAQDEFLKASGRDRKEPYPRFKGDGMYCIVVYWFIAVYHNFFGSPFCVMSYHFLFEATRMSNMTPKAAFKRNRGCMVSVL